MLTSVVVGMDDVCGLTAAGTAYSQGLNSRGQVGNGTHGPQGGTGWVPVSGALTFTSLAASAEATCGTTAQRQLDCWGGDDALLPGDSAAASDQLVPTLRTSHASFVRVVGSLGPVCALDTSGTVQCFGTANSTGLLTGLLTPVFNGQAMASVTVGEWHVCGITATGTPRCASTAPVDDPSDQGYGAMSDVVPVQQTVATPVPLRALTAGVTHTCGLDAQGHAWCWGTNSSGELGDETLATRAGPVSVTGQAP